MLSRGLPWSLLVHVLGLVLLFVYGNRVATVPVQPPRAINVRMVQLSRPEPTPVAEPVTETAPPEAQPEIKPELPPKDKPEPEPEPRTEVKQPQPEVKAPEREPEPAAETPAAPAPVVAAPAVPNVAGTDEDFPFAWYISLVEGKIINNWQPRQLNFGSRAMVSCTVRFRIARNGAVSQVTLARNSGVGVYDREALRAVQTTRLPPLPPQYKGTSLGITFIFNLEPGK